MESIRFVFPQALWLRLPVCLASSPDFSLALSSSSAFATQLASCYSRPGISRSHSECAMFLLFLLRLCFYLVRAFDDNKWEFVYAVVRLLDFMFCGKLWFYILCKTYTCVYVWWTLNFSPLPKCQYENDKNLKVQIDLVCDCVL